MVDDGESLMQQACGIFLVEAHESGATAKFVKFISVRVAYANVPGVEVAHHDAVFGGVGELQHVGGKHASGVDVAADQQVQAVPDAAGSFNAVCVLEARWQNDFVTLN